MVFCENRNKYRNGRLLCRNCKLKFNGFFRDDAGESIPLCTMHLKFEFRKLYAKGYSYEALRKRFDVSEHKFRKFWRIIKEKEDVKYDRKNRNKNP